METIAYTIRQVEHQDHVAINRIYNHFIETGVATFETDLISDEEMRQRIIEISASFPYLVLEVHNQVVGYAYGNTWKTRAAYFATVESSIYLDPEFTGKGLALPLYQKLLVQLRDAGIHLVIGGISLPNEASVQFHLKCGFEYVGVFKEVGFKHGRWVDVGYYSKRLMG